MRVLEGIPVRLGRIRQLEASDAPLRFVGAHSVYEVPVIVGDIDPTLWDLIHVFILNKAVAGAKDLMPTARAFLSWLSFLSDRDIAPFVDTRLDVNHPTKGYRAHLVQRIMDNTIASTTASTYINIIKCFYEMLVELRLVPEGCFFKHEKSVLNKGKSIQSTNLRIRRRNRNSSLSLSPLDAEAQAVFGAIVAGRPPMYRLMCRLMMNSGLRITEVCTLPIHLFTEERFAHADGPLVRDIMIGPSCGVGTKFGMERELFITTKLFEEILDYKDSDEYASRLTKWRLRNTASHLHEPLWITKRGNQITPASFYSEWQRIKNLITETTGESFDHHPHDLRSTFATNYLGTALANFPTKFDECIASTRDWMGHKHEATTLKYVRFLNRKEIANQVAEVMDDIVQACFMVDNG